ncbi:MAG: ABC transporter substrate-binding protein [Chloroflexi bacterium]|nr:ABC transporter substrate-binding protein [Chloroflexota bacterium]
MDERTNYWLRRKVSRRTALQGTAIAGVGAASIALVGCGDDDDDTGGGQGLLPTAAASPTAAKQPKPGGSFSFQISSPPPSLDPYTQTSFVNAYMNGLSYSKLYRFKAGTPEVAPADNAMEPDLATTMPEQPDPLTLIIKLKPNVKFHNGRALAAEDVRYAFDRYMNFEKSVHKSGLSFVDKIEIPDPATVKITTKIPYADFVFYTGGNLGAWISPKEHAESADAATKMVGSGPFIHTEFQTGVSLSFKKNPDYYDKPYPYFDDVKVFITTDQAKRVADFSAKSVDLTWLFLPDERDQIKKNRPDAKSDETQGIGGYIYLRTDKPPFNDKRVRQAISMGLNRKAIRDAISKGEGVPDQLYHVAFPYARQVKDLPQAKYWEYNKVEARKLLDAVIGEGKTIDTTWDHADAAIYTQAYVDTATLAQAQLKEIGINIKDQTAPYAQYISTTYQGQYEGMGHSPRAVPYWLDFVTERFTMKPKRGRINLSYVNDSKLEDLMDKQRGQFNMQERLQTVKQIEEHVAEEQYEIYFSTDTRTYFWNSDIENYRPTAWFPYTHIMKTWRDKA